MYMCICIHIYVYTHTLQRKILNHWISCCFFQQFRLSKRNYFPLHGSQHLRYLTAAFFGWPTELLVYQLQRQPLIYPPEEGNALKMPNVFSKGELQVWLRKRSETYPYHRWNSMEITENLVERTGSYPLATMQKLQSYWKVRQTWHGASYRKEREN